MYKLWTSKENDLLFKVYSTSSKTKLKSYFPNRKVDAVIQHARLILGLKSPRCKVNWTEFEDQLLTKKYGKCPRQRIKKLLPKQNI
jgi:hypothetical protein